MAKCVNESSLFIVVMIATDERYRVCTDPGKVWKVTKFKIEVFQALKSLENDQSYGKVCKKSLKTMRLTFKIWLFITLVNTPSCVCYLAFIIYRQHCGQNFHIVSMLAKMISTHLYCHHHLKSKKFCHERYFLMYFIDVPVYGGKNDLETFGK